MGTDDPQDFAGGLQNERRLLEERDEVFDADRGEIDAWLRRKDGTVAISTLKTYLRRVRVASERSDVPLVEMTAEEYQVLVFDLRHEYDLSDATVKSYENAVLLFIDDMTDAEWPEDVERTRVETSRVQQSEVLTPKDIAALTDAARHQRDVAFIEFLADTGARISLALSLRVGDVDLTDPPTFTPNDAAVGLKGAPITAYPLIDAAAPLRAYLQAAHPRPNDESVALFHKLKPSSRSGSERWSDDGAVRVNAMRQQLGRIADRTDIEKRVKPHSFRHAAITRMVREGYSRSQIEHRVHWTLDSDMWQTYEHITGQEHTEDIFRAAGVTDSDETPERVRKECGTCNEPLAPHHEFCHNCGSPVSPGAKEEYEAFSDTVLGAMVATENPVARRDLRQLHTDVESDPSLVDERHDEESS